MDTTSPPSESQAVDTAQQQSSNSTVPTAKETSPGVSGILNTYKITEEATFPLFDLPPELWIRVCKLAVTSTHDIRAPCINNNLDVNAVHQPGITRTCKAIRKETLHHFYSSNRFVAVDYGLEMLWIYTWTENIGRENRDSLKHIYVETELFDGRTRAVPFDLHIANLAVDGTPPTIYGFEAIFVCKRPKRRECDDESEGGDDDEDNEVVSQSRDSDKFDCDCDKCVVEKRIYELDIRETKRVVTIPP